MIHLLSAEDPVWDLCVIGTGPVGIALAMEFEVLGHEVLMLESGGPDVNSAMEEASRAEIVDEHTHTPMEISVCRAFGGTSWKWGGRCVGFDDIDWVRRDFVGSLSWPISHDEVRRWYERAAEYMLCGSGDFSVPFKHELKDGLRFDLVERWSSQRQLILRYRDRLLASELIKISLNSTVTSLNLSAASHRLESLTVHTPKGVRQVKSRRVILAAGGVETTRLLLHAQRKSPRSFGGMDGPLGRYYMGHLAGKIAAIHFTKAVNFKDVDFRRGPSGSYYRRRFALSAQTQLKHELSNTVFMADNPSFYDASHRSFTLSAIYLALAFKPLGRRLTAEAIRRLQAGLGNYPLAPHIRNLILGAPRGAKDLYIILRDRYLIKPPKPLFMIPNPDGHYFLAYSAEHLPSQESRITLSNETDSFGVPRARIDFRFSDRDIQNVVRSHAVLDAALQSNGLGRLEYRRPLDELPRLVRKQAEHGTHQIGTTRMGSDPAQSVVDSNLKVHGVENLYVASSSTFPTSGHANSTFLAVALAVRLAHHLKSLAHVSGLETVPMSSSH
jgi:choline dehydrogenase-like flavoprotein